MASGDAAKKAKQVMASRGKAKTKDPNKQYYLWIGISAGSVVIAMVMLLINPDRGPFQIPVNDNALISVANRNAKTWKAGASSFFDGWTIGDVKLLEGVGISAMGGAVPACKAQENLEIPEQFDAREKWPKCFTSPVYSMGNCTASWAVATASSLSNRFCISNPEEHSELMLSPQELLSCDSGNRGCNGGDLDSAWNYVQREGLVSEVCFPYQADSSVSCRTKCSSDTPLKSAAPCLANDAKSIKAEIVARGPVVAPIFLTDDFLVYRGGVYKELKTATPVIDSRRQRVLHAVKILGWGKHQRSQYWLIENSWGEDWGEGGFARIPMGHDPDKQQGMVVENYVIAGVPGGKQEEDTEANFDDLDSEDLDLDADDDLADIENTVDADTDEA